MADERKGANLAAEQLAALLSKLDEVLAEAQRLRWHVSRQLTDQRTAQQPVTSSARRRRRPARKR